jgi:hypothetical protein
MKNSVKYTLGALIALATSATPTLAADQAQAEPPAMTQPATGVLMHPGYVKAVAQMAYLWGWPMVNMHNRYAKITAAPYPGRLGGILPAAPRGQIAMLSDYILPGETFVACPNQDVVYGLGFFSLDEEPVVAQVPDFGERFWVYSLYDVRTDQFGEIGKPYQTKPGFYLLVGPSWKGEKPAGIEAIVRSPTPLANGIPRVFMDDTAEDREAIQPFINKVVFYPLKEFDGKWKTVEWNKAPTIPVPKPAGGASAGGETRWVVPEKFFDDLGKVLDGVPPLPGEEALYAQFRALLDAGAKDPAVKKLLVAAAVEAERAQSILRSHRQRCRSASRWPEAPLRLEPPRTNPRRHWSGSSTTATGCRRKRPSRCATSSITSARSTPT